MNIKEFFEIAEKFFDEKHPNLCEDYVEEESYSEIWQALEDFFNQINPPPDMLLDD